MEYLDIVDREDNVIGNAPKSEVYEKSLMHRIVHILIFNKKGEMALQLRSRTVSYCPLHWSTAVGGHVQADEPPEQAGLREYEEELGTTSEIHFLAKDFYTAEGTPDKFLYTYKTIFEGPFSIDRDVVEKIEFFTIEQIKEMIEKGEKFHPELLFILKKYFIDKL